MYITLATFVQRQHLVYHNVRGFHISYVCNNTLEVMVGIKIQYPGLVYMCVYLVDKHMLVFIVCSLFSSCTVSLLSDLIVLEFIYHGAPCRQDQQSGNCMGPGVWIVHRDKKSYQWAVQMGGTEVRAK